MMLSAFRCTEHVAVGDKGFSSVFFIINNSCIDLKVLNVLFILAIFTTSFKRAPIKSDI
jgi:hypothetical protein